MAGTALWRPPSSFCVAGAALQTCGVACSTLYTLHTPHFTLHTLHSALYTLHSTLHTLHFTPFTLHSTRYTLHSILYTPHSTLHTLHSTLYTLVFTLRTLHSTLCTPPSSAFHSLQRTGNRGKMYKTVHITCFTKVFYMTCFGFVGCILFFCLSSCNVSKMWLALAPLRSWTLQLEKKLSILDILDVRSNLALFVTSSGIFLMSKFSQVLHLYTSFCRTSIVLRSNA